MYYLRLVGQGFGVGVGHLSRIELMIGLLLHLVTWCLVVAIYAAHACSFWFLFMCGCTGLAFVAVLGVFIR